MIRWIKRILIMNIYLWSNYYSTRFSLWKAALARSKNSSQANRCIETNRLALDESSSRTFFEAGLAAEYHRYSRLGAQRLAPRRINYAARARTTVTASRKRDSRSARDRYGATGTFEPRILPLLPPRSTPLISRNNKPTARLGFKNGFSNWKMDNLGLSCWVWGSILDIDFS